MRRGLEGDQARQTDTQTTGPGDVEAGGQLLSGIWTLFEEKPLEGFKQGTDMICSIFLKDYSPSCVENIVGSQEEKTRYRRPAASWI